MFKDNGILCDQQFSVIVIEPIFNSVEILKRTVRFEHEPFVALYTCS